MSAVFSKPTWVLRSQWRWSSWRCAQTGSQMTPLSWSRPFPPWHCQTQHAYHPALMRGGKREVYYHCPRVWKIHFALVDPYNDPFLTTYQSVLEVQMKNWDPLVLGPALAIDKIPRIQLCEIVVGLLVIHVSISSKKKIEESLLSTKMLITCCVNWLRNHPCWQAINPSNITNSMAWLHKPANWWIQNSWPI